MKLYAVTKGSYSDYHIVALTADKRRAERIAVLCSDNRDDATVEEFEDREDFSIERRPIWLVNLRKDRNRNAWQIDYEDQLKLDKQINCVYPGDGYYVLCSVYVEAVDKPHALKTASDLFAQWCYENAIDPRRQDYKPPMISTHKIITAKWIYCDGIHQQCSNCGAVSILQGSFCSECFAVMNLAKFYEGIVRYG